MFSFQRSYFIDKYFSQNISRKKRKDAHGTFCVCDVRKNSTGDKYTNLIDRIESIYTSVNPNNKIIESGSIKMKSKCIKIISFRVFGMEIWSIYFIFNLFTSPMIHWSITFSTLVKVKEICLLICLFNEYKLQSTIFFEKL